jgi:hypothetical protein
MDTWSQIGDFEGSARRYMVSFVIRSTAFCGTGTNGTNLKDFWSYNPTLNVSENENLVVVNCYPNPAKDQINFTLPSSLINSGTQLIIFNSVGQIVDQKEINEVTIQLKRNELDGGIYYYRLINSIETISTGKFIFTE